MRPIITVLFEKIGERSNAMAEVLPREWYVGSEITAQNYRFPTLKTREILKPALIPKPLHDSVV